MFDKLLDCIKLIYTENSVQYNEDISINTTSFILVLETAISIPNLIR